MFKRLFLFMIMVIILAVSATSALAAPTAAVSLNTDVSSCSYGQLKIATTGISGGREYWRVSANGVILGEAEEAGTSDDHYSGTYGFPFKNGFADPDSLVTLYGYQGSTPPTAATTAEFTLTYNCTTLDVIASCAGAYGTCGLPEAGAGTSIPTQCLNTLDGRINNNGAFDCAAPIVLFKVGNRLDVYGVGGGESTLLFSINDDEIASGHVAIQASIPGIGQPVAASSSGGGVLLEAHYEDGKPYTILYTLPGTVTHLAW